VNYVNQTIRIISNWIGFEDPGTEQGHHNQDEPPTTDCPTNWLQRRPNGN
jgi:hypothetical protein